MNETGIEICFNVVRRDKYSTYRALAERVKIKTWRQILEEKGYINDK